MQVLLYLILNVIRGFVFLLAFPLLRGIPAEGYKLDWKG